MEGAIAMERLDQLAYIVRSKNAGPFYFTLDILFDNSEKYLRAKNSGQFTPDHMGKLYNRPQEDFEIFFFDNAWGIKVTYPRKASAGDFEDTDCYGAQQHAPLLGIMIP